MCGGPAMDLKVSSTIGFERAHNRELAERDEERFVAGAIARLGPQPPNFRAIVEVNRGPLRAGDSHAPPLTPRQVVGHQEAGALIVDVRTELQFDDAHIPGAVCVTALRGGFGSRLAWIADHDQPVVFVGRDDADAAAAAELAAAVAVTNVAGCLAGGMTSWREERRPTQAVPRLTVPELHERWERDPDGLQVLDVRERQEWVEGHIPGSLHVPYHDLHELPDELDPARPVAAVCASGQRSAVAASLLQRQGASSVLHVVDGGVGTWARRGWPVER
jgi:rhodanese-related sulfurtransferase